MRLSPFLCLVLCAAASADGAASPGRVANGAWGGEHVRLIVADGGATIEFDCAHGTLDSPLLLDGHGRFDVSGSLVAEGGPLLKDSPRAARPVRYRGEVDAEHMKLEVALAGGESGGSFALMKNGRARLVKCR